MADVAKRMVGPKQLESSTTTQYTAPAGGAIVKQVFIHNSDTVARTITIGIGADAAGTRILNGLSIPAGEAQSFDVWWPMTNGELLKGHASAASVVQIIVGGVET